MSSEITELYSFPVAPLQHSRPWRSVGAGDRCATESKNGDVGKQSYLLDRYYVDDANPLLRNWTSDQFMQAPHSPWPLVLYGPPGVGKTLLAETLVRRISPNYRYTTGEDFRRQFIEACETRSVGHFQDHFADGDVLLIDNLAAPPNEASLNAEWVRLFDSYHASSRPILVTTSVAPFWDECLSPSLRSRLSGGLSIAVQPPERVARQAIIKRLLDRYGLVVESRELEWLTGQLPKTVAALGNELSRIAIHSQATIKSSSLVANGVIGREALSEWIGKKKLDLDSQRFSILLRLVSRRFQLRASDITGAGRQRQRVKARGVIVWLARHCFSAPYSRIGRLLGKRDASTIRHAFDCIDRIRIEDSRMEKQLQDLARNIESRIANDDRDAALPESCTGIVREG